MNAEAKQVITDIRDQLYAGNRWVVGSWGTHAMRAIPQGTLNVKGHTLQFKVNGRNFSGHVRVEYDRGQDLYIIHFGRYGSQHPDRWKNIKTITSVFAGDMTRFIDDYVEYVEIYAERAKQWG